VKVRSHQESIDHLTEELSASHGFTSDKVKRILRECGGDVDLARHEVLFERIPDIRYESEKWFNHFDVDKSGSLSQDEVTEAILRTPGVAFDRHDITIHWPAWDPDGNGVIDQDEMTKIVQAIYDMLGAGATKPTDSAEERAKNIFSRMDDNGDGHLTEEEFLSGCMQDDELSKMLAPNVVQ